MQYSSLVMQIDLRSILVHPALTAAIFALLYFLATTGYLVASTLAAARLANTLDVLKTIELHKGIIFMAGSSIVFGLVSWLALRMLRRKQTELDELTSAYVESDRRAVIGQLSATIGHDMNNLLASAQLALDRIDPARKDCEEYKEILRSSIEELSILSRGMVKYAREGLQASPEETDPVDVLRKVLKIILMHDKLRNIKLQTIFLGPPIEPAIGRWVLYRVLFVQMVTNLLLNAGEASGSGGTVRLTVGRKGAKLAVEVDDSGPGISAESRDRIFDPFFTSKGRQGSGLGLLSVRACASLHDGSIEVGISDLGGAKFAVHLGNAEIQQSGNHHAAMQH